MKAKGTSSALSVNYTYTNDLLTGIRTPTAVYSLGYGAFGLQENIRVGSRTLATYGYTPETNYLSALDYGNGDSVQYTYDSLGRTMAQTWEDNDAVTYAYDNSSGLASIFDSATGRTTKYYYDFTDRLMKYTVTGSNHAHSVEYKYDATNKLLELVETVNGTVLTTSYTYDKDNRVTSVTTETKTTTGSNTVTTTVTEEYIYDYNFNTGNESDDGLGSILNNFGYWLQSLGKGTEYYWEVEYEYKRYKLLY